MNKFLDNPYQNINQTVFDDFQLTIKECNLTDLEKKIFYLSRLTARYTRSDFFFKSPQLKTENGYLSNDGYPLGCFVWYMNCNIYGRRLNIFGKNPENTVENAIVFFENFIANVIRSENIIKKDIYIEAFESQQRENIDEYAKYPKTDSSEVL